MSKPEPKYKRAWMCMNPARLQLRNGQEVPPPRECLGLFALYRTKKQAREIHGPKCRLTECEYPVFPGEREW